MARRGGVNGPALVAVGTVTAAAFIGGAFVLLPPQAPETLLGDQAALRPTMTPRLDRGADDPPGDAADQSAGPRTGDAPGGPDVALQTVSPADPAGTASGTPQAERLHQPRDVAAAGPTQEAETTGEAESDTAPVGPVALPVAPRFDVVRAERDGSLLVAGVAAPGTRVRLEVDGAPTAEGEADGAGSFALFLSLPPTEEARILTLAAIDGTGEETRSTQSIILAPPTPSLPPTVATADPADPAPREGGDAVALARPMAAGSAPAAVAEETSAPGATQPTQPVDGARAAADAPNIAVAGAVGDAGTPPPSSQAEDVRADAEPTSAPAEGATTAPARAEAPSAPTTADADPLRSAGAGEGAAAGAEARAQSTETAADAAPPTDRAGTAAPALAGVVDRAPAVLLAEADAVRLLQPSTPAEEVLDRVVIDVISYDADGTVTLEGRSAAPPPPIDRVRVYLDNAPVDSARIAQDGSWRLPLSEIAAGIYTLRVDQLDRGGRVVSRFETPFKREDPAALARFEGGPDDAALRASVITVQPGYTLWGIASDRYGDGFKYVQIFEANDDQIRDPDLIFPGQIFDLPDEAPN